MEISQLKKKFVEIYGGDESDIRVFSAAGRVNLIGEHIDYCGGKVFPAALNLRTAIVARKNGSDKIRLTATTVDDKVTLDINTLDAYKDLKWGDYQAGVAYVMQQKGYKIVGCDLLYDTTVPFGSGLSSSASIEVATAMLFSTFSKEEGVKDVDLVQLAVLSQLSENTYNGVNCGIMDQFASSLGKKDMAILLDCKTLDYKYTPLKLGDYSMVIANCNKKRSLQDSKYNERRGEVEEALAILQTALPSVTCLAEITPEQFDKNCHLLEGKGRILDRAKHVVYECDRVLKSVKALEEGKIEEFGELLNQSHYSLRDLYEVTGKELDALTKYSRAFDGCIGSRMTGAGFGGCTISIVKSDKVDEFIKYVNENYAKEIGYEASFYKTSVENGAQEI
ncbi:MAG: galactokinase [Clostridiales bacterium]|nr:galactokinase [Clostridiales bacterium]